MHSIEVTALDHVYVCVSDLARSLSFYDPVMALLGFKKGTKPIAGEPHVHYYNRVMQYSLRPARSGEQAHPYAVGALHHLCFRVADREAVEAAWRGLRDLGIAGSEPRLYEYRPDYYATFFEDPDGLRLEIVCDTELRRTLRRRWDELEGFEDPVSRLAPAPVSPVPDAHSLLADLPPALADELVEVLDRSDGVRVERIVSHGHASPPGFWYDQEERELVVVVEGAAAVAVEGRGAPIRMERGDWVLLEPHVRHRVEWTDPKRSTVWLAVFYAGR